MKSLVGLIAVFLLGYPAGLTQAEELKPSGYKIIQKVSLPEDGGWDFLTVDSAGGRLYVTHANRVQVLELNTLKLIGTIAGVSRPHGVVILAQLGKGFVTSGDPGSVVVFDLKTLKKISEISAPKDADVILYDKPSGKIFTFNGDSQNATVIDPVKGKAVQTLDLGGSPEVAVSDGKGHLFDNLADKNLILKIDSKTLKVTQRWPTGPGTSPTGLAMDLQHNRLLIGCRNKLLVVMNANNGKILATLPIGEHVDSTAFDPKTGNVFNSCGDGTLSVIHEESKNRYRLGENVPTEPGARTLALDTSTGRLYLPTAQLGPEPKPTKAEPKPRRKPLPGTFHLLVVGN
jgi:DNA-binding beta-propeller fold protein YncE